MRLLVDDGSTPRGPDGSLRRIDGKRVSANRLGNSISR
jgi:hypothetical protein